MPPSTRLVAVIRTLTRGARLDADLDAELRAHVDLLTDEKVAAGLSPAAARRAALLEVGGVEQVKERVRDVRVGIWLETVWQDVRYAARMLRRSPAFTLVAVLSLALGLGLNAVVFSAVQAVLLRPLPYADPVRVVDVYQFFKSGFEAGGVPPAVYREWVRSSRSFEGLAVYDGFNRDAVFRDRGLVEHIQVVRVSSSFFRVLGRGAALGRVLESGDDTPGANVAVVSDDWWTRRWGRDPKLLGRAISIDNVAYPVVGIMPPGFRFYRQRGYGNVSDTTDIWLSDPFRHTPPENDVFTTLSAVGRLRAGVSTTEAESELSAISLAFRRQRSLPNDLAGVRVLPLRESLTDSGRRTLIISWAIAGFVLLIAAANVAVLSLARTESRRAELVLRGALGAGRLRLVRQLLTESALLAVSAGVIGAVVTVWAGPLLNVLLPRTDMLLRLSEARPTWQVVAFTLGTTVLSVIAFGAAPAWIGSQRSGVRAGDSSRAMTRRGGWLRHALVVSQLSLSLVVVAATALLVATAWREQHVSLGFLPDHLLTMNVRYPRTSPYVSALGVRSTELGVYGQGPYGRLTEQSFALTPYGRSLPGRIATRLAVLPGVAAAAVGSSMPMLRSMSEGFKVDAPDTSPGGAIDRWVLNCAITPDFFKALALPLIRGRAITARDALGGPKVAVVNEMLARHFLGGVDRSIGRHVITTDVTYEVVGVVSDARYWTRLEVGPQMYTAFDQQVKDIYGATGALWRLDFWVAVRTERQDADMVAAITGALREVDGGAPIERVEFMDAIVARGSENARGLLRLLLLSGATALFLAAMGVFGVTAFAANLRVREFGIRIALGASPRRILALVLSTGARLAAAGTIIGVTGAYWTNRVLESELYGVRPTDPRLLAIVSLVLIVVVLVAAWWPARRAARVDPAVTLRAE